MWQTHLTKGSGLEVSRAPTCQQYRAQSPIEKGKCFITAATKGETRAVNKLVKLCATSLIIREMHIKTVTRVQHVFIKMPKIKNIGNA